MSISIDTIGKFIGIATGIITIIEGIARLITLVSPTPDQPKPTKLSIIISVGKWVFLVSTTLGLMSVLLAILGANLGMRGQGDINDQFRNSIGYATAFSMLYGVFWGSVLRPWLSILTK